MTDTIYDEVANVTSEDIIVDNTTDIPKKEYTPGEVKKYNILRNVYIKLDALPLGFGIPRYNDDMTDDAIERYFRTDYADTIRETRININDIESGSIDEMQIENRIVYHALRRFRLSASAFFKFSTATDGKTVDKTQIPKMLSTIISEYDNEYKKWRLGNIGSLWNRSVSE